MDSYGDGGTYFEVYADGVLNHAWQGTGTGNEWTFDPFEMSGPAYDSPCGAAEIEVDGAMVIVSNDSCSAAYVSRVRPISRSIPVDQWRMV